MINLLPIGRLISFVAIMYAAIVAVILLFTINSYTNALDAITLAASGSLALNMTIFGLIYIGWRKVWGIFPILNKVLFPDLNGTWKMTIHWEFNEHQKGVTKAHAVINQNFLQIGMDVDSNDSESETIMAKPKKDPTTGRGILYYIYLTTPKEKSKAPDKSPYRGVAILKVDLLDEGTLKGNYFTSRGSTGYYEMSRVNTP